MSQIMVPRSFGGTLVNITFTPSTSPVPTLAVTAIFRDGNGQATYRDGKQQATHRDGVVTPGGR